MRLVVTVYLVVLTIWSLGATITFLLRNWIRPRRSTSVERSPKIPLFRDIFHLVLGVSLIFLLRANHIGPVLALALSAVLIIAFEYGLVLSRKLRPDRE